VLRSVVGQLRQLVTADDAGDEGLRRLYPTAYATDPEADAEYQTLMHPDLVGGRLEAIDLVLATVDADRIDEDQLGAWMGVVNDLRLVLGTRLDIGEETEIDAVADDDPDVASYALYGWLTWLLDQMITALDR